MRYLTRKRAADHLTAIGRPTAPQALADMASDGVGPPYGLVRGRALYEVSALEDWVAAEMARPVPRRSRAKQATTSAQSAS